MKLPTFFLPAMSAGLLLSACEKQPTDSASPSAEPKPATSTPASPAVAEAPVKVDADKLLEASAHRGRRSRAAQAIRAENYGAALETLEHLLAQGHLTPEQKELATGFISQLQKLKQQKR